jgi:arabinosyltransferase
MGWARYAHSMRIFVFNSGLFYLRPTPAALDLLAMVVHRVETENGWDQALFNECIFFPSSPRGKDPSVTRRVLDINQFMNSKFLFKVLRHDAGRYAATKPVMVHVNYHPDKFERMKAVVKRYVDGEKAALDPFPDGSQ